MTANKPHTTKILAHFHTNQSGRIHIALDITKIIQQNPFVVVYYHLF